MPEFPPGSEAILKSLEIDKAIFREELFGLRYEYWEIQGEIKGSYDFGLLELECAPIKDKIARHVRKLIDHLEAYQKKDFLGKMELILNEIRIVRSKLEEPAESIDEVMMLLDYIEVVKKPESKVDELTGEIKTLKVKMDYLIELEIAVQSDEYWQYLELLGWP
jgi:hypothetical protein